MLIFVHHLKNQQAKHEKITFYVSLEKKWTNYENQESTNAIPDAQKTWRKQCKV